MQELHSPDRRTITGISIFLAGSIDNGQATDWQHGVAQAFADLPVTLLNPRRRGWDASLAPVKGNPVFDEQVAWELEHIESATFVLFYFVPGSVSVVSMLELGLVLGKQPHKAVVVAPTGYFRTGNIQITCERHGVKTCGSLDEGLKNLRDKIAIRLR